MRDSLVIEHAVDRGIGRAALRQLKGSDAVVILEGLKMDARDRCRELHHTGQCDPGHAELIDGLKDGGDGDGLQQLRLIDAVGADVLHGLRHGKGGIRTALRIEDQRIDVLVVEHAVHALEVRVRLVHDKALELVAIVEAHAADGGKALAEHNLLQGAAAVKGGRADGLHGIRQDDAGQLAAAIEGKIADGLEGFAEVEFRQRGDVVEAALANFRHACGQGHGCHGGIIECRFADVGQTGGQLRIAELLARAERTLFDTGNGRGDDDLSQRIAAGEHFLRNGGHALRHSGLLRILLLAQCLCSFQQAEGQHFVKLLDERKFVRVGKLSFQYVVQRCECQGRVEVVFQRRAERGTQRLHGSFVVLSLIFQRCNAGNELFVRRGGVVKALKRERQRLSVMGL